MELAELIKAVKEAESGGGIAIASHYLGSLETCLADETCVRSRLQGIDYAKWQEALRSSEGQLTYHNPDMKVAGSRNLITQTKRGRFEKRRKPQANSVMEFDCVLTSTREDHERDILHSDGADIDPKMALLWQHMPFMPIGKYLETLSQNKSKVMVAASIADTELGRDSATLVEFGALRISHGFLPIEFEAIKQKEDDKNHRPPGWRIRKFKVLEMSLVSVPANQDAVITAFSREKLHHPLVKSWAMGLNHSRTKSVPVTIPGTPITIEVKLTGSSEFGHKSGCSCHDDEGEPLDGKEVELLGKPLPNEHSCRLRNPGDFKPDTFRRVTRKHEGKTYAIIMGKLKQGESKMTEQAYRYPKATWTASDAKAHCRNHEGGTFEAARENSTGTEVKGKMSGGDMGSLTEACTYCDHAIKRDDFPAHARVLVEQGKAMVSGVIARHQAEEGKAGKQVTRTDLSDLSDAHVHITTAMQTEGVHSTSKTYLGKSSGLIEGVHNRHRGGEADDGKQSSTRAADLLATRLIGMLLTGKDINRSIFFELLSVCRQHDRDLTAKEALDYLTNHK